MPIKYRFIYICLLPDIGFQQPDLGGRGENDLFRVGGEEGGLSAPEKEFVPFVIAKKRFSVQTDIHNERIQGGEITDLPGLQV
jgi:hypothetical protein